MNNRTRIVLGVLFVLLIGSLTMIFMLERPDDKATSSEVNIPMTTLDNFDSDTSKLIDNVGMDLEKEKIALNSTDDMKNYLSKYNKNPRLNDEQESMILSILILDVAYSNINLFGDEYLKKNDNAKTVFETYENLKDKYEDYLESK